MSMNTPMPDIRIVKVDRESLKDRVTVFSYDSDGHYRVDISEHEDGWTINLAKEKFHERYHKRDERDKTVQPYKGDSEIYLAYVGDEEAGQLQIEFQEFNKSVRVWDIDVWPKFKRYKIGTALINLCKDRAKELGARRIVLETQSSNLAAIEFYKSMGFKLIGLDASHYHNDDVERCEVRLEMAYHF